MRNHNREKNPFYGKKHTKKSKRKMSESHMGNVPWNKGLTKKDDIRIEENAKKQSERKKGKTVTELGHKFDCTCICCEAKRGNTYGKNNSFYGQHHTKETKKNISKKNKGRPSPFKGTTKENSEKARKTSIALKGRVFSKEWRKKLSIANTGRKHSKETCKKMSASSKGKKKSPSHRRNISNGLKGREMLWTNKISKTLTELYKDKEKCPMYGRHHSEESKQKMREKRRTWIMPVKDTSIEVKIQDFCKELGVKYKPHKYIKIKHGYCCDLFLSDYNTIIECDGDYWHNRPEMIEKDILRNKEMKDAGYNVIRLWEHEIRKMEVNDFQDMLVEKFGIYY